jgi:hypothetical protein
MKYKLTFDKSKRALFTVHRKAVYAGDAWVVRNPGHSFEIVAVDEFGMDYNVVTVYEQDRDGNDNFVGWLADEDVS